MHSPYGCSKGCGDQYVRDYQRIYGLPTVVFRQSAIYGPRQFGVEDQGWAAHFVIAAQTGRPISIYGDGKQVRDMLYIDDLIDLYELALDRIDLTAGKIYNVGGGPANSLSIWAEFQPLLSRFAGRPVEAARYGDWRPGDQPVCILDVRKAEAELGWRPKVGVEQGMRRLWDWVAEHSNLFV
jgi:CDP-paratose 2-epimerase